MVHFLIRKWYTFKLVYTDRKISMAFTYRKHVVYDLKVIDL